MEMVAQAESEVAGTAVVRGGIKAGKEQVKEDGQLTGPHSLLPRTPRTWRWKWSPRTPTRPRCP